MTEPVFFPATDGTPLFATWREARGARERTSDSAAAPCWVICAPFAEEEKSAHRILVELCEALQARGESTLFFAYGGTGDSASEFAASSLTSWREDILDAYAYTARRSGNIPGMIGLRIGASLAVQVAAQVGTSQLILVEPVLSGRSFLMQLGARKKLRAMITSEEAGSQTEEAQVASEKVESEKVAITNTQLQASAVIQKGVEDYDGWPVSQAMRNELGALDLIKNLPALSERCEVLLLQVGPREQLSPPLLKWASELKSKNPSSRIESRAAVMPPFWNRLDLVANNPFLDTIKDFTFQNAPVNNSGFENLQPEKNVISAFKERAVTFQNARRETLVGVFHEPYDAKETVHPKNPIVLLHGWTGYRTGPHQMLTRAARRLAAHGFPVLRFDFAGRGDSEGDCELATLATMTEDARAALRFVENQTESTRTILIGLCSGCEVALATTAFEKDKIEKLVLWSAPIFAAQKTEERVARKRKNHLKDYARKLLRPATWAKVISGKVDVRGVKKVLDQGGGQENKNLESGDPGFLPRGWRSRVLGLFNQTTTPVFLIYGTSDPTTDEALKWHRDLLASRQDNAKTNSQLGDVNSPEVHLVEGANHSYYGLDWEAKVFQTTENWLQCIDAKTTK